MDHVSVQKETMYSPTPWNAFPALVDVLFAIVQLLVKIALYLYYLKMDHVWLDATLDTLLQVKLAPHAQVDALIVKKPTHVKYATQAFTCIEELAMQIVELEIAVLMEVMELLLAQTTQHVLLVILLVKLVFNTLQNVLLVYQVKETFININVWPRAQLELMQIMEYVNFVLFHALLA